MIGRRWDWHKPVKIDFSDDQWQEKIKKAALSDGHLHQDTGIDYFIHSKTTFPFVYDFAIGKFVWDQWLVGNAYRRNMYTVNLTNTVFAIHQDTPWFQYGKIQSQALAVQNTPEYRINRSFDNYRLTISRGTRWSSKRDANGNIVFGKKKESSRTRKPKFSNYLEPGNLVTILNQETSLNQEI